MSARSETSYWTDIVFCVLTLLAALLLACDTGGIASITATAQMSQDADLADAVDVAAHEREVDQHAIADRNATPTPSAARRVEFPTTQSSSIE